MAWVSFEVTFVVAFIWLRFISSIRLVWIRLRLLPFRKMCTMPRLSDSPWSRRKFDLIDYFDYLFFCRCCCWYYSELWSCYLLHCLLWRILSDYNGSDSTDSGSIRNCVLRHVLISELRDYRAACRVDVNLAPNALYQIHPFIRSEWVRCSVRHLTITIISFDWD